MTDPFSAAVTAAQTAQAAAAALAQENTSLTGQHAADQQTIAQQAAQIADLEAQLHPKTETLFGVSASTKVQHDSYAKLLGSVGVWRYYRQPGERPAPPTEYTLGPGERMIASTKVKPQDVVTGRYDADFLSLFRWLGDNWFCPWHEPADDVERGNFTVAQYRAMWDHLTPLARQTSVRLTPILMRATYAGAKGRKPADYLPDDYDAAGVDAYVAGSIGVKATEIGTLLDPVRAASSKPIVVGETGVGQDVTGQARTDTLTQLASYYRTASDVSAVCYFLGSGRNEWRLSQADAAAWNAGRAG
ncbi:MAG TPA: hypothetical protein VFH56_04440 [Acidimicrobiales bacterium]|nr:hypothetical protein [Acidimicrobiales bacterium]